MLSFTQDYLLVILTVAGSLLLILGMNRLWPPQTRRAHNELIGWQLTVLGTTYAVILGFMLYTVWTNFGTADVNVGAEANSVVNVYHLAEGFREPSAPNWRRPRWPMSTPCWVRNGQP